MHYLNEEYLVEKPIIEYLENMSYTHLNGENISDIREDEYSVVESAH